MALADGRKRVAPRVLVNSRPAEPAARVLRVDRANIRADGRGMALGSIDVAGADE